MGVEENQATEETKVEEQAEGQEQEQAATEEKPAEEAEAKAEETEEAKAEAGAEGEKADEEEAKPEEKHKRAGGWQRKIERLERQNQMLVEQLAAHRPQEKPADAEKTSEEKAAEYIDQLVEKRIAAREAEARQRDAQAKFQQRLDATRAANPDFDEVVLSVEAPVSPALQQALLSSDDPGAIMYQLAKSPAELARLSALPPLDAAREIGRLEARLASSTPPPKPKPAVRPPAPPTTVNGSTSSTRSLDGLSMADYKRAYRSGQR